MKAQTIQKCYKDDSKYEEPHIKRGSKRAKCTPTEPKEDDPKAEEDSKEPHTKRGSKRATCKPTEPKEDEPKAEDDAQTQQGAAACKIGIKNADAVIMSVGHAIPRQAEWTFRENANLQMAHSKQLAYLDCVNKKALEKRIGRRCWTKSKLKVDNAPRATCLCCVMD